MTDESKLASVVLMDPQQLYELWERQNWQSQDIDFTQDKEDWKGLSEEDRKQVAWNLSSFFVGEERVTTQFTGLVAAYESQSEEAFVATQQVDEARHAQHFNRFYEQVVGYDGTFDDRLERAREDLNEAFLILFDQHLVDACKRLLADPSDVEAKVDFITTYHMVIEGTLALTGQFYITEWCEKERPVPRLRRGLQAHLQGRAPARRLRHLVPQGEVRGPGARPARAGQAGRAPARRRRRVRPAGHAAGRLLRDPRLLLGRGQRVRLHRAVAAAEGDRDQPPGRGGGGMSPAETAIAQLWMCESCGMIYDPAAGDPDGGVAPGTPFEDIPNDWFCPVCGARKADFVPYEG